MIWKLAGYDSFSAEMYPLGDFEAGEDGRSRIDGMKPFYGTREEAVADAMVRLADLERAQPTASSGGQDGIQDRVYLVHPDGRHERVHPAIREQHQADH